MKHLPVIDALRLQAERSQPGTFVEGWTDRPSVPPDLRPIWDSFCAFWKWRDQSPSAVIEWVRAHHWRESPAGIALIVDVIMGLIDEHLTLTEPAPKSEESSGD